MESRTRSPQNFFCRQVLKSMMGRRAWFRDSAKDTFSFPPETCWRTTLFCVLTPKAFHRGVAMWVHHFGPHQNIATTTGHITLTAWSPEDESHWLWISRLFVLQHEQIKVFNFEWIVSTATGWIVVTCADIHVPLRMKCSTFLRFMTKLTWHSCNPQLYFLW